MDERKIEIINYLNCFVKTYAPIWPFNNCTVTTIQITAGMKRKAKYKRIGFSEKPIFGQILYSIDKMFHLCGFYIVNKLYFTIDPVNFETRFLGMNRIRNT